MYVLSTLIFVHILKERQKVRINDQIRARELRVVDSIDGNLGLLSLEEALRRAREKNLDLIEVSPHAVPPIAKIMDYGKFQYEIAKKFKEVKSKSKTTETKTLQVKLGTGENDLEIKAKQASGWLKDGDRVQFNLYLKGREKYLDETFLRSRLERVLKLLTENYKIAEPIKKNQKGGFSTAIERQK